MTINSRSKGSRNERSIAKVMENWTGYEFARTPQSGGLHWKKAHTSGDIVCIDDKHGYRFNFSIECKFHEDLDLFPLIQGLIGKKSNKIIEFWKQSDIDARVVKKIPLVFMRRNGMKKDLHFVMFDNRLFQIWLNELGQWNTENGFLSYSTDSESLIIINSDDLVKTEYLAFHRAGRKLKRQLYGTSE